MAKDYKIKCCKREEACVSYKDIVELIHESFQERLDKGLRYSCSFMTEEQYIQKTKDGIIFVAVDEESGCLAGTAVLNLRFDGKRKYGYFEFAAGNNSYKHCGIGSLLLLLRKEAAMNAECSYILSDTSTKAESAVKYHLKNGFKIVGYESYRSTNYWSYVFRMQLEPSVFWNNNVFLKFHFFCSYIFIKLTRTIDGDDTCLGKIYKQLKNICKN